MAASKIHAQKAHAATRGLFVGRYTAKPGRLVRNCDGKLEECRRQCRRRTGNGPAWLSRAEVTSCSGTSPS